MGMPNSNLDRRLAGDRLKGYGFELDGAVPFLWLVIHHSATPDGKTHEWPAIKKYHMEHNGWSDIGYHAGIERVGENVLIQVGRPLIRVGAHVAGFNSQSFGLCLVGNFDKATPDAGTWSMALDLSLDIMRWFTIPVSRVIGHREAYDKMGQVRQKSCPGLRFVMDDFRGALNDRLLKAVS